MVGGRRVEEGALRGPNMVAVYDAAQRTWLDVRVQGSGPSPRSRYHERAACTPTLGCQTVRCSCHVPAVATLQFRLLVTQSRETFATVMAHVSPLLAAGIEPMHCPPMSECRSTDAMCV